MHDPPDLEQKLSFNALPPPSPSAGSVAPDSKHVSLCFHDAHSSNLYSTTILTNLYSTNTYTNY